MRDVMNRTELIACLHDLDACNEAIAWIEKTPGEPEDLWAACPCGDWMIWLLKKLTYDERVMRHIACDVAEDVLHIYEREYPADRRPRDAIAMARRYADGEATRRELIAASDAASDAARAAEAAARAAADYSAYAAAKAAVWATARAAARAAADAASKAAAWATARAAADAAPSDASWAAAWATARAAARAAAIARHADMIRARVSWADVERALEMFRAQGGGA